MNRLFQSIRSVVAVCSLGVFLAGRGDGRPTRVAISGQVLIDGQPLTCGFISIMPEGARMSTGEIGSDGRFTMSGFEKDDGVVLGTHKATVTSFERIDDATRKWLAP
jgi:hypothetical protein